MQNHETIDYLEIPCRDLEADKEFFKRVFSWQFEDYGDGYTAFTDKTILGGLVKSDLIASTANGSALIVFYSEVLEDTQQKVINAGGIIIEPTFDFPGGRRFHFSSPSGNEFAVWSANKKASL